MSQQGCIVRLRGLPWSTRKDEITTFLSECNIDGGDDGIHFTFSREGRPSGEAFVELSSEDCVANALAQNNEHIGNRYIEVFRVDKSEMDWMIKRAGANAARNLTMPDAIVKLRGLPFGCTKEEISQFFQGMEIAPNGIMLPEERPGRNAGEAFVQFASSDIAEKAVKEKHKDRIGHRYIEIFKSSMGEANAVGGGGRGIRPLMGGPRPCPYDRGDRFGMGMGPMMGMGFGRGRGRNLKGFYDDDYEDFGFPSFGMRNRRGGGMNPMRGGRGGMGMGMADRRNMQPGSLYVSKTGHSVHMRGLPFQANDQDVFDFFAPIQPVRCEFEFGDNGRPSGEANVDFATHQEAVEAMKKHKNNMQPTRSTGSGGGGGGGYGNGMSGGNFGGGNMGGNDFHDDMGPGSYNQGSGNAGFGGGYGGGNQGSFGQNQGNYGSQGGFSNTGFNQGMNNYDMGGGYGDGVGNGGGMMGNNYTAF